MPGDCVPGDCVPGVDDEAVDDVGDGRGRGGHLYGSVVVAGRFVAGQVEAPSSRIRAMVSGRSIAEK